jgi:phosphinothricin acetyltransferase
MRHERAVVVRPAVVADAEAICRIYNEGIEDRIATFETRLRSPAEIEAWFNRHHPIVVVHDGVQVLGFAASFTYRPRDAYRGIAEFSVYVGRSVRSRGIGRLAMDGLIAAAESAGFWKLVSRVIAENEASRGLLRSVGFREVGIYRRHARLDGTWRDAVVVERLLGEAAAG